MRSVKKFLHLICLSFCGHLLECGLLNSTAFLKTHKNKERKKRKKNMICLFKDKWTVMSSPKVGGDLFLRSLDYFILSMLFHAHWVLQPAHTMAMVHDLNQKYTCITWFQSSQGLYGKHNNYSEQSLPVVVIVVFMTAMHQCVSGSS